MRTIRAIAILLALVLASVATATSAHAAPMTTAAHTRGGCIQDTSTHDKQVPGEPIHLVNQVHFIWCPGKSTITNKWAQLTARSTNGKPLHCAGVWTKFHFADRMGNTQGSKKIHVMCGSSTKVVWHRAPITDGKHYKVRKHAWPKWTGYNQVAYYGSPQSFVWIRGQLNPFEVGHFMTTLVDVAFDAVASDRVAGQAASVV